MPFSFQYNFLLWLLLLLPVLAAVFFYARHKKRQVFKKMGDEALVKELTANYRPASFLQKFALALAAMALILLTIANLRSSRGSGQINRNGIDVMIALDVSKSMLAQDVKPNRLDRAKQVLYKLMDRLDNDRIGLVVFAGKAYLQMPLTGDHSAAKMYLSAATPETVPTQGTVIGDALKMCFASFNAKEKKYKAVILISDGEDHDENAVRIAGQMAKEGVVINAVGIGSAEGAPIMDEKTNELKKDAEGNTVITKLNEQALADVSDKGNGEYLLYTNTDAVVSSLYKQLSTMDTRTVMDESLANYQTWFQYLLGVALLLLVLDLFIPEVKRQSSFKKKVLVTGMLFFPGLASFSQANKIIREGNDAYKKNDYKTAATYYDSVVKKDETNATAEYNLGNALYKTGRKKEATAAYDKANTGMTTPVEKSKALYNAGVVMQEDKALEECIVSYKNALKADPANADARHNLQIALREQKQKQDQQNKENQDKKNNKDKDKDKKKQDDKKDQPPKPNPSSMSKKDAEQKLQALMQKEKDLQDKLHKVSAQAPNTPEKDW